MEVEAKEREALASRTYGKDALDHTIAAAELYMKAARAASIPGEKSRLTKKCHEVLSRAEALKKLGQDRNSVEIVEKRLKLPRPTRQVPASEQAILLRSSRLHGNIFPPWESDPDPNEFSDELFGDPSEFSLSERQKAVFAGWKRPLDIVGSGAQPDPNSQDDGFLMEAKLDYDLVQDVTTDCSVVASLCASMRHLRPGPTSILPTIMFPCDLQSGQPNISRSGKYVFRMFFNGCFRKVVIDDRLPSSSNDRTLYVVDRQNPGLVWPALMEKAYLKVRGGYDFPGSNSGTDLCALTGWIPQQLFLQSDEIDWDRTWKRVKKAYDYGDVVITLGTGRLSPDEEETLGLAGEHDYAVLDMAETQGNRKMLVKNPWCDGLVWKGVGSSEAASQATADGHPVKLKPGSFWISFDDVTQNFESLYLNWNPSLFTERQDHHFTWKPPQAIIAGSFVHNPQYSMEAAADGSTWILLSRHFQDGELEIMRNHQVTTSLAAVSSKLGFMSVYVFADGGGKRVQLSDRPVYRGDFVDSPQMLAPFEAKKGVRYTVVVAAQELPLPQYSFTLSFFSRAALAVAPAQPPFRHYAEVRGSWTRRTAGGNAAAPTYVQNPQFGVTLPQAGPLSLLLSTARDDLPVHVDLVWAAGRRVVAVGNRDLVVTSGDYRRGCALAESASVDAGAYTVVCSTFEPGCLADFVLRVGSDCPVTIAPVLADAAGRLRTHLPILAPGGAGKVRAVVSAARLTRASVVVTRSGDGGGNSSNNSAQQQQPLNHPGSGSSTPRPRPTVRVSLEYGTGPDKAVLASTDDDGNYYHQYDVDGRGAAAPGAGRTGTLARAAAAAADVGSAAGPGEFRVVGPAGLRTPEFDIDPRARGGRPLWLVVEQLGLYHGGGGGGAADGLLVEILSEGPVRAGAWEAVDD
ncbi:cysteine proteinase [Durotheca rogersii]|uniref:cysteine proteinase n=1 Tax=Durotheca rogersii TaxID=419775 RepID=UPI00221EF2DC|nr:cysteine proteinase [Durotheca rogersii]KAI5863196.1 cysteine proteinase [Durotheca rogersii]